MMDVQEIFNRVIDGGFYQGGYDYNNYSDLMCISLFQARNKGVITPDEDKYAENVIKNYLNDWSGCVQLYNVLKNNALENSFKARLAIYKDWDNRPKLHNLKGE